jgi:hypothetical protein
MITLCEVAVVITPILLDVIHVTSMATSDKASVTLKPPFSNPLK